MLKVETSLSMMVLLHQNTYWKIQLLICYSQGCYEHYKHEYDTDYLSFYAYIVMQDKKQTSKLQTNQEIHFVLFGCQHLH